MVDAGVDADLPAHAGPDRRQGRGAARATRRVEPALTADEVAPGAGRAASALAAEAAARRGRRPDPRRDGDRQHRQRRPAPAPPGARAPGGLHRRWAPATTRRAWRARPRRCSAPRPAVDATDAAGGAGRIRRAGDRHDGRRWCWAAAAQPARGRRRRLHLQRRRPGRDPPGARPRATTASSPTPRPSAATRCCWRPWTREPLLDWACASARGPAGCWPRRCCARRPRMLSEVASLDDVLSGRL